MEFNRCLHCMETVQSYPCPHCGYDPATAKDSDYVLRPGTILNGKYVVGTILGQGGFGITYVGWDLALGCKVAIKEYYPSGQVTRDNTTGNTLHWLNTPQSEAAQDTGKEMFLKEARKMTRVRNIPQVVHVHDLFQQNDTAYIVMDFVEGKTLKAHLTKPLTWEEAKKIFFPAIRAMEQVHQAGLVHRDLSPDNLMLLPDGSVQILDLGAAKDLNINSGASSMQVAKSGFSPWEQYTQRGGSGPWSDVYSMAATMYYSLTGVVPPPVMDRMVDDQLRWDLGSLKTLPKPVLEAMKKAMALLAKDRTQSMGEFLEQLEKATPAPGPTPDPGPDPDPDPIPVPSQKTLLAAIAAVLVVALLAGWLLTPKQDSPSQNPQPLPQLADTLPTEETVPTTDVTEPATDVTEWPTGETEGPTDATEDINAPPPPPPETDPLSTEAPIHKINYLGGVYKGTTKKGIPEGEGTLTWEEGTFEGEFRNGYPDGEGTFRYASDSGMASASGQWSYGKTTLKYEKGMWKGDEYAQYTGMLLEAVPCGYGNLDFQNENSYSGTFANGHPAGQGTYYYADGSETSGIFTWGKGIKMLLHPTRIGGTMSYTGMLKENEPSGYGTLEFEEGGSFYGEFSSGTVDGSGVYVFRASRGEIDDPIYGNDWSIVYDQDCDLPGCKRYSGLTLHGIFQGYGLGITPLDNHYVGEVLNYCRSGYGRVYLSNNAEPSEKGMYAGGELQN